MVFLAILVSATLISSVAAQRVYHLDHEWVKIWIRQDGTIDLFYDVSMTLDSGSSISYVNIGQPKRDFTIGLAIDQYGHNLTTADVSSGDDYKVRVYLYQPLTAGHTVRFNLTTNVAHMIWEDTMNAGNVGLQFIPTWWQEATVATLNVSVVLPLGVNSSMVKTSVNWNGTTVEDGQLAIYWERQNLPPNQQYSFGVSFPKEYVERYDTQPSGIEAFFRQYGLFLLVLAAIIIVLVLVIYAVRKGSYLMPTISMETLGVRRGLTAVEASYLLDMKPPQIVTEILYGLLQKRAVWVESTNPSIKLRIMPPFQNKTGTPQTPLRYYEYDFLDAMKENGTLEEEKLAQTVMFLRETVEQKLRGYCRRDTIDYYRKVAAKAWEQVEQAGTAELASQTYDEQLLWLFLDPNYKSRTELVFQDRPFEPSPLWLWYWYGYQHYHSHPTYTPNVDTPTSAAKPPAIPGVDFANNIATSLEKTSNNVVVDLERFAAAILPMPAAEKASGEPARHESGCVCACASCACVCACVSCACACASGGVG